MDPVIPRVVDLDDEKRMFRALIMLMRATKPGLTAQAQLLHPGLGMTPRYEEALNGLQDDQLLLVAGAYPKEETWRPTPEILLDYSYGFDQFCRGCLTAAMEDLAKDADQYDPANLSHADQLDGVARVVMHDSARVHFQGRASNTKMQSRWVAKTLGELNIRTVRLNVSFYHLPRAIMTNLPQLKLLGLDNSVAMLPWSTEELPDDLVPEFGDTIEQHIPGEVERILKYQGDVASWDDLYLYLKAMLRRLA